jgi:CBS domain-containing protein
VKAVAVARNVPLLEPAGMVSEAGTVRLVELELKPTVAPVDPLRETVQVLEPPGVTAPGLHAMELIEVVTGATLTVPPVPGRVIGLPVGDAPRLLLILIGRALLPDRVTDRVATTPSEMALEFNPQAMHV